jgi:protein-S-isoprenylcysteine O-methyltransferase Ste14
LAVLHLYVVNLEEPRASRQFGEAYLNYTRQVNRWWPRLPNRK